MNGLVIGQPWMRSFFSFKAGNGKITIEYAKLMSYQNIWPDRTLLGGVAIKYATYHKCRNELLASTHVPYYTFKGAKKSSIISRMRTEGHVPFKSVSASGQGDLVVFAVFVWNLAILRNKSGFFATCTYLFGAFCFLIKIKIFLKIWSLWYRCFYTDFTPMSRMCGEIHEDILHVQAWTRPAKKKNLAICAQLCQSVRKKEHPNQAHIMVKK